MFTLKTACCCFTLRTGNLIIGWLNLIGGLLLVGVLAYLIPVIDQLKPEDLPQDLTREEFKSAVIIALVIMVLSVIMAICHVYGSYKSRRGFLVPYLIVGALQIVSLVAYIIFFLAKQRFTEAIMQTISLLISFYFYLIPWSFYKELREGDRSVRQHP